MSEIYYNLKRAGPSGSQPEQLWPGFFCALDLPDLSRAKFSLWTGAQEVARFKVDHFQILALSAGQVMLFKAKRVGEASTFAAVSNISMFTRVGCACVVTTSYQTSWAAEPRRKGGLGFFGFW